jgi:hypothetical protein
MSQDQGSSRRDFIKKAAYIAPVVMSLQSIPAIARNGSPDIGTPVKGNNGLGQRIDDTQPPGNPPINDKPTSIPGQPNNQGGPN